MFSLTDSLRYWYYNRPTDMRKSFHTLGGIVTDVMKRDPYSGEVFIFMNRTLSPSTRAFANFTSGTKVGSSATVCGTSCADTWSAGQHKIVSDSII